MSIDVKKYCENCKHYQHKPNIIGGISECVIDVKPLNTFWRNDACEKYNEVSSKQIPEFFMPGRLEELSQQIKRQ
jgi:hypothetical protein